MKIDKLYSCIKSILSIFHDFNDPKRKSANVVFFGIELESTAEEQLVNKHENEKRRNYYTHNFLSKALYCVHKNKNGSL